MSIAINPSILSADFVNFQSEFDSISNSDYIHVDVMDGHFVPNLTFGLPMVKRMAEISTRPLDVHLMIDRVDEFAIGYAEAGAKSISFHQEASVDCIKLARRIREVGAKASVAVKPGTSLEKVIDSVNEFDMVLIMTVEPGFGGQRFMNEMLPKIQELRAEISRLGLSTDIQVDGGINRHTIISAANAGANSFVAGSSVFSAANRVSEIEILRNLAEQNYKI